MEKIILTFLGTSDSIPSKERNHTSVLLAYKNENILIDCGEGTQRQFKLANISPTKITRILITHWHGDHILGLPGMLQTMAMLGYNKKLEIYTPKKTRHFMEAIMKMFIFVGNIKYEIEEVNGKFLENQDFYLESFPLKHSTSCNGYIFVEKDKLRINKEKLKRYNLPNSPLIKQLLDRKDIIFNGKKIKSKDITYLQKGRKISFVLDTGYSDNILSHVKDSDIFVCESTYLNKDEEIAKRYHHLTAKQSAIIAKKAKVKHLILTHISQRYNQTTKYTEEEAKSIFKNMSIAKDFDKIEI